MTDLEITKVCAKAMGHRPYTENGVPQNSSDHSIYIIDERDEAVYRNYDPLNNDAECMALVKKFRLETSSYDDGGWLVRNCGFERKEIAVSSKDLNRAICKCVANRS